jgi:hypothetical protein
MIVQVGLVSQSKQVPFSDIALVSAALQKQATRDFGPLWQVQATVDPFARLGDVPVGYWPVVVRDDVMSKQQAAGIHLDKNGQPFALVQAQEGWPMTASHEVLEMLADPFGERMIAGQAPKEAKGQGRVEYLVEVCDPSEDEKFGYTVNDILLADFYTPNYFDPITAPGVRYSFTGAINKPRQVLRGGYISWHNLVDDHWYQLTWFSGAKPTVRDIGVFDASTKSAREMIDECTVTPRMARPIKPVKSILAARTGTTASTASRAAALEAEIAARIG